MARLGDICTIYSGTGFPVQYQGTAEGQYPFYKVGDIAKNVTAGNKYLVFCENYVEADIVKIIKGNVLPSRTVVFAKIGEAVKLNRRAITSCECLIDNNAMGIAPNESVLTLDYFFHYMCSLRLETLAEATTVPSVKKSLIEKLDIPLPSLLEQEKISTMLNKVGELITLRKEQLAKLDQLVKSRFIELFGDPVQNPMEWETVLLKSATSKIGSGATPKGGKESYQTEGITLIRSMNVHDGRFEYKDLAHITDEQAKQLENVTVEENDVFINITGASVARSCIVPKHILPARVNQHVAIIRCITSMLNPVFANQMFLNTSFKGQLLDIGESGGATRQAITKQQLETLMVILPPLELQKQFATFVDQTDKSKLAIQQSLDKLELLKKSLMQEYFG